MRQDVPPLSGRAVQVINVPRPSIDHTEVLVRTTAGVISSGRPPRRVGEQFVFSSMPIAPIATPGRPRRRRGNRRPSAGNARPVGFLLDIERMFV